MRVAIYSRVSTDRTNKAKKQQEAENQLLQLRTFVATQGWAVTREYVDRITGGTSERDQFQQMFHDASQRRFDIVIFWSLDRFSREGVLATLRHLERLSSYGVTWKSLTEPFLDSAGVFRDAMISILAVLAKQERVRISERTKAGLERVRAKGTRLGRPGLAVDIQTARERIAAGQSLRSVARDLGCSPALLCKRLHSQAVPAI